jgi:hypothetical protein
MSSQLAVGGAVGHVDVIELFVSPLRKQRNSGVVPASLRTAVEAVAIALDELRADPG